MNKTDFDSSTKTKQIEHRLNSLVEQFHSTIDSVNQLQDKSAILLLDNAKHYQLDLVNRLEQIQTKIDTFQTRQIQNRTS